MVVIQATQVAIARKSLFDLGSGGHYEAVGTRDSDGADNYICKGFTLARIHKYACEVRTPNALQRNRPVSNSSAIEARASQTSSMKFMFADASSTSHRETRPETSTVAQEKQD